MQKQGKRRHYVILPAAYGTVDVFLRPEVTSYPTQDGQREYDIRVIAVRGVTPWDGMEQDIRRDFDAWCEIGEEVYL